MILLNNDVCIADGWVWSFAITRFLNCHIQFGLHLCPSDFFQAVSGLVDAYFTKHSIIPKVDDRLFVGIIAG